MADRGVEPRLSGYEPEMLPLHSSAIKGLTANNKLNFPILEISTGSRLVIIYIIQ